MKTLVYYSAILSSIVSFLISIFFLGNIAEEFYLTTFYPVIYGFFFMLLWPKFKNKARSGRITVGVFLCLQWLRLVLQPALSAISGYLTISGGMMDHSSAQTASILVLFESIVTFMTAFLILKKTSRTELQPGSNTLTGLSGNHWVYLLFILFAAVLFIRDGADMYTFFALDVAVEQRASLSEEGANVVMSAIIDYGLSFLVILLIYFSCEKYKRTGRKRYMYLSLLVAIARICIIQSGSDGRLAVLYPIGTCLMLLTNLYPKHRKTIIRSIVLVGVTVLGLMTIYKVFRAFFYDSYLDALQSNAEGFGVYGWAEQIDIYFYGVRTIANNLYVSQYIDLDISTLFTDFLRNTFGVHYLIKDTLNTTVAKYNLFIYGGESASGYLYSSLAYGASYFTVVLAPLTTVINMVIVAGFEKWMRRLRSIDGYYIIGVVFVRMAYNMFACLPLSWNYASRTLVLGALVIGGASLLKTKKRIGSLQERTSYL